MRADLIALDAVEAALRAVLKSIEDKFGFERDAKPSLDLFYPLLESLGEPQRRLPPIVHVAGTNGKGSTCAFVRAIAEAAGLKVHVLTSPHLVTFRERIRLGGRLVGKKELLLAVSRVLTALGERKSTFFEVTTAAAFLLFSEQPADLLVLEVGLGGLYDATNVIDAPACSVITPIGFDHMSRLGNTIAEIASQKGGIIKMNAPVVIAPQRAEALNVLTRIAMQRNAPAFIAERHYQFGLKGAAFSYAGQSLNLHGAELGLVGPHQAENAAAALAAMEVVWPQLPNAGELTNAIALKGLKAAQWPARMQPMAAGPLSVAAGPAELWLDGAHNPAGMASLVAAVRALPTAPGHIGIVFAAHGDKDIGGLLEQIAELGAHVVAIPLPGGKGVLPHTVQELAKARRLHLQVDVADDLGEAVALAAALGAGRIVIAGSLYLAGAALIENGEDIR